MYIARFAVGDCEWVQATVKIESGPTGAFGTGSPAWDLITSQLSAATRIEQATLAYRIGIDGKRALRQTIALTAPAEQERSIRLIIARLTRVERLQGGGMSVPVARAERDEWMEGVGRYRWSPTADGFSVAGLPLACEFRLSDALDELLTDAAIAGERVAYQLHIRAADVSPDDVRSARKNVLALRDLPGIRAGLLDLQEELARKLGHAVAFCEEYVVADSPSFTSSASQLLADRFRARYGPFGFPATTFQFQRDAYQDQITAGVHSHDLDPLSPVALCSVAESAAGRDRLLSWQPSARLHTLLGQAAGRLDAAPDDDAGQGEIPNDHTAPPPYVGHGPAVFVSYKRADFARVSPVIRLLQELGLPVWYDRGIPGGTEWDEVIEERLEHALFVVVCASQRAIASKYVRREVKYADSRNVPILPVLLEEVVPAHGMGMLLTQYQMLDVRDTAFVERLQAAAERMPRSAVQ